MSKWKREGVASPDDFEASDGDQPVLVAVTRDRPTTANNQPAITNFDGGFLVDCGELVCCAEGQNGTWKLSFDIYITTTTWEGRQETRRKVPSNTLREQLWNLLGIRTRLAGHPVYPSLVGRLPHRPDPHELLAAMRTLLVTVDLDMLFTEPDETW